MDKLIRAALSAVAVVAATVVAHVIFAYAIPDDEDL